jgi:hypothetical protein
MNLPKEKNPRALLHDMGWRAQRTCSLLPVAGDLFPLTLPFIERRYRPCGFQVSGNAVDSTGRCNTIEWMFFLRMVSMPQKKMGETFA